MALRIHRNTALAVSGLAVLATAFTAGCKKPGGSSGDDAALVSSGKAVFASSGCANCHSINGQGGRKGQDLSKEGAGGHNADWLVAHIKNPKTHNPMSRMPSFAGKISDQDMLALGAYLASLK